MEHENDLIGGITLGQHLAGLTDEELNFGIQCAQDQIEGVVNIEASGCPVYTKPQQTLNSYLDERARRMGLVPTISNNKVMLLGLGLLAYYLYTKRK